MHKLETCIIVTMTSFEGNEDNGCLSVFQPWGVFLNVVCLTGGFIMLKSGTEISAKWVVMQTGALSPPSRNEWIPRE